VLKIEGLKVLIPLSVFFLKGIFAQVKSSLNQRKFF